MGGVVKLEVDGVVDAFFNFHTKAFSVSFSETNSTRYSSLCA